MRNVKFQKTVHKNFEETLEANAMMVKIQNNGRAASYKTSFKKREAKKKEDRFCDDSQYTGINSL